VLNRKQITTIVVFAVLLGLIGAVIDFPFWVLLIITLIVTGMVSYFPVVMNLYVTKDMNKVEAFLQERLNQPVFHFYYALANEDDFQVEKALRSVLEKYKLKHYQAVYTVTYKAYKGRLSEVRELLGKIKQPALRFYYEALLAIEVGELEGASKLVAEQKKPWMREIIAAEIAENRGEQKKATLHQHSAVELTRGLQRYLIVKKYGLGN